MKDSPRIFCSPPLLFATVLVFCLWFDGSFATHASPAWARIAGIGLVALGVTLIISSLGLFFSRRTRPEPWKPATTLVTDGIYRFTRNPMYLGMATVYAGVALAYLSGLAAVLLIPLQILMNRLVIPREEAYLSRQFTHEYVRYLGRVRRWL